MFYFDLKTNRYEKITDIGSRPTPRAAFGYTQNQHMAYLFGGRCAQGRQNDLYQFDLRNFTWTCLRYDTTLSSIIPTPRSWLSLTVVDGELVVYGGLDLESQALNDAWLLMKKQSGKDETIIQCKRFPLKSQKEKSRTHTSRMWHTAFYNEFNGKLAIFGGSNDGHPSNKEYSTPEPNILQYNGTILLFIFPENEREHIYSRFPDSFLDLNSSFGFHENLSSSGTLQESQS